jgi:hypothetical protein
VERDLALADATAENLKICGEWFDLLEKEPDPGELSKFGYTADMRQ